MMKSVYRLYGQLLRADWLWEILSGVYETELHDTKGFDRWMTEDTAGKSHLKTGDKVKAVN